MKCPSCNKFASYDEPVVEINSAEVDDDGSVTVEGRMVLNAACCGDELKSWDFLLEDNTLADQSSHDTTKGEHEMDVECDDGTASDYFDGKPGTPARYRKHMYVVEATATVTCSCGFVAALQLKDENTASGFDELT